MRVAYDGKNIAIAFLSIALMGTVAGLGMTVARYNTLAATIDDPAALAREQTKRIVRAVGALMDLPKGEEPRIATVNDVHQLANEPFFAKAKNGDKVIIYTQAHLAILFDPVTKKVTNVGNFSGSPQATESGTVAGIETEK